MPAFINLVGHRFGRLVVTGRADNKKRKVAWHYACDCGRVGVAFGGDLRDGRQQSCGCLHREIVTKHNHHKSGAYKSWQAMKSRCYNQEAQGYRHYGGRGIRVCERWLTSFDNFLADMGDRPPGYTLDRLNVDGHYEPGNCRWATRSQQARNRRDSRTYTHDGLTMTLDDWAGRLGLDRELIRARLRIGWSFAKATTTPPPGRSR